jgi:hypothetical protein
MNAKPRRVLRQLITQYGVELHRDPKRTESLLRDLCGDHQREIFVLIQAQRAGVASELLKSQRWQASSVLWKRLSRQLQDHRAFTEEAADWAVESWAHALDLIPQRQGQSWLSKQLVKVDSWVAEHDALATVVGGIVASGRFFRKNSVKLGRIRMWRRRIMQGTASGGLERTTSISERRRTILIVGLLALVITSAALFVPQVSARLPASLSDGLFFGNKLKADATDIDLAIYYPLPQTAWLNADLFDVHAEPSIQSPVVSQLGPAGAQVAVDAYSTDGQWSHISTPVNGWIGNDVIYLAATLLPADNTAGGVDDQVAGSASTIFVHVGIVNGQVAESSLRLREGPGTNYAVRGSLDAHQPVVIIAWTLDGSWLQVAKPEAGWVSADFVQVQWPTDALTN